MFLSRIALAALIAVLVPAAAASAAVDTTGSGLAGPASTAIQRTEDTALAQLTGARAAVGTSGQVLSVDVKGCSMKGNVPQNPEWMYLLPVHCAFHTNRSMQLLMDQWGYRCSVYNEHAKLWVLFRQPPTDIEPAVAALNQAMGWRYLHYKAGFMDYWK